MYPKFTRGAEGHGGPRPWVRADVGCSQGTPLQKGGRPSEGYVLGGLAGMGSPGPTRLRPWCVS
jgi:hypothetical protein